MEWPKDGKVALIFMDALGPVHKVVFDHKFKKRLSDLPPVSMIEVTGILDLPDEESAVLELVAEDFVVLEPYVT